MFMLRFMFMLRGHEATLGHTRSDTQISPLNVDNGLSTLSGAFE
jgi:hypothetical protein